MIHPSTYGTIILPDGNVSNASAPIQVAGHTYTLTASFTGSILDERNGSVLNGNGMTLTQVNGTDAAFIGFNVDRLVVENLSVESTTTGILLEAVQGAVVTGNHLTGAGWSVDAEDSVNLSVVGNTGSGMNGTTYGGDVNVSVLNNVLSNSSGNAIGIVDSSVVSITGNQANGSAVGVEVLRSDHVNLIANELSSTGHGIVEKGVSFSFVRSNTLTLSQMAIHVENGNTVSGSLNTGSGGIEGIAILGTTGATFTSETFSGFTTGAYLEHDLNVSLTSSQFTGAQHAVMVGNTTNLVVASNNLSSFRSVATWVGFSSNVTVQSNLLLNGNRTSSSALSMCSDRNVRVEGNAARGDSVAFQDALSSTLRVTYNDFSGSAGLPAAVWLSDDSQATVENNNVSGADHAGIEADSTQNLVFEFNLDSRAGYSAVNLSGVNSAVVENNTIDHAGNVGLLLNHSSGLTVQYNPGGFTQQANGTGILATFVSASVIDQNNATHVGDALAISNCTDLQLLNNNGSLSTMGLRLVDDVNTTAAGNWFYDDQVGFMVDGNSGVWVYHNNFVGDAGWSNPPSAQVVHWDAGYPEGGNYWGNHTGPDLYSGPGQVWPNPDGLVDSPLEINASNIDRYPLTTLWFGYTLTFTASGLHNFPWSVVLNGQTFTSPALTIVIPQANGPGATYQFRIPTVAGYTVAEPAAGPYLDERTNITILVLFTAFLFPVTFTEYGLAVGTQWSIVLGSTVFGGLGSSVVTALPNGSYNYLAGKVAGYLAVVAAGVIYVQGQTVQVTIVYAQSPTSGSSAGGISTMSILLVAGGLVVGVAVAWFVFGPLGRKRSGKSPPPTTPWARPITGSLGGHAGPESAPGGASDRSEAAHDGTPSGRIEVP
ncbi:MAG: right-handed parallel beta-helix repeat-containing protein [Thermoplasmata archaeon]|nr:right-handed parallel beta-helix repeat-containing protein [Thermoplasmata archaeon]